MTCLFSLRNRQRVRAVDTMLFRRLARQLLRDILRVPRYELAVHLVEAPEMTRLNQTYLSHAGSTDVITFDYGNEEQAAPYLHGEIFICLDEAVRQAGQFGVTWQSELARYFIHGVLHLLGFDDRTIVSRRKMKREENRLLRELSRNQVLARLAHRKARGRVASLS